MSIPGQFDSRVHDIAYGSSSTLLGQGQLDPGQASGAFLPEEQANWPRRSHPWSSSLCNVTAEPGAEPRLPNAQLLALRPLSCMGPMSLDPESSGTSTPDHLLTQKGKSGVGPKERQKLPPPGKKPEERVAGPPRAAHLVVSRDNVRGGPPGGYPPIPQPCAHALRGRNTFHK